MKERECCVLTMPLLTEKWQEDIIEKRFKIMEHLKNSLIAYEKRKLKNLQRTKEYKDIVQNLENANPEQKKALYKKRKELLIQAGFAKYTFENDMTPMQKHFVEHIAVQIAHKASWDVWKAFEKMLFGSGKTVHFERRGELKSIACKTIGNGMNFRNGYFEWSGGRCTNKIFLKIKVLDPETYYEKEMLKKKIKSLRIIRKWSKNKYKYYIQFTIEGKPAYKPRKIGNGKKVGIDIGPSSVAIVAENEVHLMELADKVVNNDKKKLFLQQKMDRSRRATNLENFNKNGTIKKGKLNWVYSHHYEKMKNQVRELERKNAAIRKYQHVCLANEVISLGTEIYVENMSFSGLQRRAKETTYNQNGRPNRKKRFGKSIANRAPAMFLTILKQKLQIYADVEIHEVNTQKFRASQYDHISNTYKKKLLKERWAELGNGDKVQRDLYSAFLLMNSAGNLEQANRKYCEDTYDKFKMLHDKKINSLIMENKKHLSSFGIA